MGSYWYVVHDLNLQVVLSHSQSHGDDVLENGNVEGKRIWDSTKGKSLLFLFFQLLIVILGIEIDCGWYPNTH